VDNDSKNLIVAGYDGQIAIQSVSKLSTVSFSSITKMLFTAYDITQISNRELDLYQINDVGFFSLGKMGSNIIYSCSGGGIFSIWDIKNRILLRQCHISTSRIFVNFNFKMILLLEFV
jgi:WD40 repeat protein